MPLGPPGVRTGLGSQEEIVSADGVGENGTVVPLLTGAASAPWRSFHASFGHSHGSEFQMVLTTTDAGNVARGVPIFEKQK